ncbi:MAG TPA: APC family permease [Solirubrobacteraceae bacterium]
MASSTEVLGGHAQQTGAPAPVAPKGLRRGIIGLVGETVLGVVQTAPAYSVAVTLGVLVAAVGLQAPAALLLGFVPILCMTIVEREFVLREPDAGTVFVWVGKSLGPRLGWIASWALLAATFIALANLANITGKYFFLLIDANGAANSHWATILVGCAWLAVSAYLGARGLEISSRTQIVLLAAGLAVLAVFVVTAVVKQLGGSAGSQAIAFSFDWLNPGSIGGGGALSSGLLLAIFFYWGWDGPAAVVEESRGGTHTPRIALALSAAGLLVCYLVIAIVMEAFAGVGSHGIGLANEENSGDVLAVVGDKVLGTGLGHLTKAAVLLSAAAALTASVVPTARSMLSMGFYRALPAPFGRVDPRTGSPVFSTIAVAVASSAFLVLLTILSTDVLGDSISAIVLLIAFYYTLLGLACLWYFRHELLRSTGDFLSKGLAAAVGAGILGWALVRNLESTYAKHYGLTSLLGIGSVFVIGVGTLVLGGVLMLAMNAHSPSFFRGETLAPGWSPPGERGDAE